MTPSEMLFLRGHLSVRFTEHPQEKGWAPARVMWTHPPRPPGPLLPQDGQQEGCPRVMEGMRVHTHTPTRGDHVSSLPREPHGSLLSGVSPSHQPQRGNHFLISHLHPASPTDVPPRISQSVPRPQVWTGLQGSPCSCLTLRPHWAPSARMGSTRLQCSPSPRTPFLDGSGAKLTARHWSSTPTLTT